ncbi:MAG: gliding motility-associated C-terminal domain-containing protein [Bacteroidales bacterium]|nr:gliding motility-associated C-terminal domain-containing protein [Bacteroidales bacterium]
MKKIWLFISFFLSVGTLQATHQKAAEITYRHVDENTYAFTLVTYTYLGSLADRPTLDIVWRGQGGGGQMLNVPRLRHMDYHADSTRESHYEFSITFPGSGTYIISMEDPNRNGGVINLPNSINTPIYVETILIHNTAIMPRNSSPTLLNKPIDNGCVGVPFMHNPGAFDPDGDSLSFRLVNCRGAGGLEISRYSFPAASDSISLNAITGDLIWASPVLEGEYNLAILIEEFRRDREIGTVMRVGAMMRDMQINIQRCTNQPPELHVPDKICVFAGDTLRVPIMATDPDTADIVTLSATGGIFNLHQHQADSISAVGKSPVYDTLVWMPQHVHVQHNPHPVYFRARDNGRPNLNAFKTMFIHVIGRAPEWDSIVPTYQAISLHWTPILDENIIGYRIYRSRSRADTEQDPCDFGYVGDTIANEFRVRREMSTFLDTNVDQNFLYCYRMVVVYRNGMESQVSGDSCVTRLSNTPILEKVSVIETDESLGKIELAWRRPLDIDIASDGTNFRYVVYRLNNEEFQPVATHLIDDTIYIDNGLNTQNFYYTYKVELMQKQDESWESIGFSNEATSIFANATGRNRRVNVQWQYTHPWITEGFAIYRKKSWETNFDSIFFTNQIFFTDTNVINDTSYTYKIKAFGRHYRDSINDYVLINWSQETETTPQIDTPCIVDELIVEPNCKPLQNKLEWWYFDDWCYDQDLLYHIFYNPTKDGVFTEIALTHNPDYPFTDTGRYIGCYYIRVSNRDYISEPSKTVCITEQEYYEMCMDYRLPNVFTPNDDKINDEFKAFPHDYSGEFTIKIFSRWGNLVFESKDPDFAWDGKHHTTKQPCPEGVYFYIAELGIPGREFTNRKTLQGSVTLLR